MMIIVSNTSPISNLATVGQLSLMSQLYGRILIPRAVHEELLDISELVANCLRMF